MQEVEKNWNEFWKEIVTNPDGSINEDQVKKELSDFSFVMRQVPRVYDHVTGGTLSKVMYNADTVITMADEHYQALHRLRAHSEYDFFDQDRVFVENSDGSYDYFLLIYEQESAAWMLVPFADKNFNDQKKDESGNNLPAEFLYAYGYDLLERVEEYNFEELP